MSSGSPPGAKATGRPRAPRRTAARRGSRGPERRARAVRPAMTLTSFGHVCRSPTWGESHGPALGAVVDGCPPGIALSEAAIQPWLDRRRPGASRHTTQRQEADAVRILSGVFEGVTTGTPIALQ